MKLIKYLALCIGLSGCAPFAKPVINEVGSPQGLEYALESTYEAYDDVFPKGTGFVVDGKFVTASHVVGSENYYAVNETNVFKGKIEKRDSILDVVVGYSNSFGMGLGDYKELHIGDDVYLLGNRSLKGIRVRKCKLFSKTDKMFATEPEDLVLTGCEMSGGDSGSPVVYLKDGRPEVVGMLIAGRKDDNGVNYGRARSSDTLLEVLKNGLRKM